MVASYVPAKLQGILNPSKNPLFVPAGTGHITRLKMKDQKGYNLSWWEEKSFFNYPFMLMPAFYGLEYRYFREEFKIPKKDFTLIADSGGFELLSHESRNKKIVIEALSVLRWGEKNADILLTLDRPPVELHGKTAPVPLDFRGFKRSAQRTYDNNVIYKDNRENKDLKIYNVIHGHRVDHLEYWFKMMREFNENGDFDGWCVAPKPPNSPLMVALQGIFMMEKGATNGLHMLGFSGYDVSPTAIFLGRYIENLTFDTASYGQGAMYRNYWNPLDLKQRPIGFGKRFSGKLKGLPCVCPVCSVCTPEIYNGEGAIPGALISLHNLWVFIDYMKKMTALKDDDELFLDYVERNCAKETVQSINMIIDYVDKGWDYAITKYINKGEKSLTRFMKRL